MFKFKSLIVLFIIVFLAAPLMAKKVKTVEHKDGVVTDLRLNYTLNVLDNWKVKKYKEKEDDIKIMRTFFSQKNYQVNSEAKQFDGDFTIPEIQIYAIPTDMTPEVFVDTLKASVKSHNSNLKIVNKLNIIMSGEFIQQREVILAGEHCIQAFFKRNWDRHIQGDPNDPRLRAYGGLKVQSIHDVHLMYILSHDGWLYVMQGIVEAEFYSRLEPEFNQIIQSLKFNDKQQADSAE